MAKTWSNRKVTDYVSPVLRDRNRPSSASVFAVALITLVVFFVGFMTFVVVKMETNPPREQLQSQTVAPSEAK